MPSMEDSLPQAEPEVFFCDLCQESIPEQDLLSGQAVEIQGRRVCRVCRRKLVPPLPSARWAAFLALLAFLAAAGAGTFLLFQKKDLDRWRREEVSRREALARAWKQEGERSRAQVETLEKEVRALGGRLERVGKFQADLARTQADFMAALEAVKKDFFSLRASLEGKVLTLAERLSALETALEGNRKGIEKLAKGLAQLKQRAPSPVPSPPRSAKGASLPKAPEAPARPARADLAKLEKMLGSSEADQRWKAVEALEKVHSPRAVLLVCKALQDPDIWVRRLAAEALGRMGKAEAVGPLIEALADQESMIRAAALASLKTLTGKSFGFDPSGSPGARKRALNLWRAWWAKQKEKGKSPKG